MKLIVKQENHQRNGGTNYGNRQKGGVMKNIIEKFKIQPDLKNQCHSCLMPFKRDLEKRESDIYCSYCFKDGALVYKGNDLKEFQKMCYHGMRCGGVNILLAKLFTFTIRFAPRWKSK